MGGLFSRGRKSTDPATAFIIGEPIHSTFKHVGGHTGGDPMASLKELVDEDDKKVADKDKASASAKKSIGGGGGGGGGGGDKGGKEQEPASEKKGETHSSDDDGEDTSYDSDEYKETPASPKPTEKEKEDTQGGSDNEGS